MSGLNLTVRRDWQEQLYRKMTENTHLWRTGQVLILLSAVLVFCITLLNLPRLWVNVLRFSLSWSLFLGFALWTLYRRSRGRVTLSLLLIPILFALAASAAYLDPRVPQGVSDILPYWAVVISLIIPAVSWSIMLPILSRHPVEARRLGLHVNEWLPNVVIGAMSGGALAVHLLFITEFLPGDAVARLGFSESALLWSFSLLAGLWVPAEEFLFRGLGFHLLFEEAGNSYWNTTLRITVLNVLLYLVLALYTPSITLGLVVLVYRTGLSLINVFLLYRRKSLLPCMVANLVFTFVMMQLFPL